MIGRVLMGIVAFLLLLGFAGAINAGIKTWRTDDLTQSAVIGAGASTAEVHLDRELYQDSHTQVISIKSSISETPAATNYNTATGNLTISGLDSGSSRTLTIEYYSETLDTTMQTIGPFLAILIFGGCAGAIVWSMFKKGRR